MKTYIVPVIHTTTGWITVCAESLDLAEKEAYRLNDEGVGIDDLMNCESESEVMVHEMLEQAPIENS